MVGWEQLVEAVWPTWVLRILGVAVVWGVAWFVTRYLGQWVASLDRRLDVAELDERELGLVDRILDIAVILVALILTTYLLGLTELLYGLITAAGIAGVALGFAVKDLAANVVSGALLLLDGTMVEGDSVEVAGQGGTVQRISLRSTEIVDWDGQVVTIPNSAIATGVVLNYSRAERRRAHVVFSVMADQDVGQAIRIMLEQAQADPRVLEDPAPNVVAKGVRDRAMEVELLCWMKSEDWFQTRSDLHKAILEAFQAGGVELAIPVLKNF